MLQHISAKTDQKSRQRMSEPDHIPVPLAHTPNVSAYQNGQVGMTLQEQGNEEGFIYSDYTVEITQ